MPANLASRLHTLPASTKQVVIVHAPSYGSTHATLEAFVKTSSGWHPQFAPMAARVGQDGFSDQHVEGVPTTPVGVFGFGSTMYGVNADPGVRYSYHRLVTDDWWDENPSSPTYNRFVHSSTNPGGASEALWKETLDYQYFAVIAYNTADTPGRGSGIFLHVESSNATAGCVSLPKADLVEVLRWLNPSLHPRIVIAPDSVLHRY